ncbi:hypothetical protein OC835_006046 [Tilletia horrida]|nr:hypothetical protein OC835_006046 [Tilletia horrida]
MARGDDAQASGARKRPRTSRTSTGASAGAGRIGAGAGTAIHPHYHHQHGHPHGAPLPHSLALTPGLSADDLHGPINLLRVNGHREPGRYAVVPEETQALFDKDPELDALLWFPAPPLDGPTQVKRQRYTLLRPPVHSLDYLYERIVQQQKEKEQQQQHQPASSVPADPEPVSKGKSSQKRGKSSKKRKAPAAARAGQKAAPEPVDSGDAAAPNVTDADVAEEIIAEEEAERLLLTSLQTLAAPEGQASSADAISDAFDSFLKKSEQNFFDNFRSDR